MNILASVLNDTMETWAYAQQAILVFLFPFIFKGEMWRGNNHQKKKKNTPKKQQQKKNPKILSPKKVSGF